MSDAAAAPRGSPLEVLRVFLRLGLTSFGGPVAHLGYFRAELVERRRWLDESAFVELVGLCQFLPGPASSQVGFALGLLRAGWLGGLAAFCGFTLPSALLMLAAARGVSMWNERAGAGVLHGLKLVAVAVVAQAVWSLARALCPDRARAAIAAVSAALVLGRASALLPIALGASAGLLFCREVEPREARPLQFGVGRRAALACGALFAALLVVPALLELARHAPPALALYNAFYRSGALVFGGGHVVLPLLRSAVVERGWAGDPIFLAGYGAAQAMPGPLFTFAAYLGSVASPLPGLAGGLLALLAIFLPGLLLVAGALPFWSRLRTRPQAQSAMRGINAAVVGLLGAALYDPLWTSTIHGRLDFAAALSLFVALTAGRAPPLVVVLLGAGCGAALQSFGG